MDKNTNFELQVISWDHYSKLFVKSGPQSCTETTQWAFFYVLKQPKSEEDTLYNRY